LQAVAALRSKKSAKYGVKWAFLGQTACHLSSYKWLKAWSKTSKPLKIDTKEPVLQVMRLKFTDSLWIGKEEKIKVCK
jgi:hypothetical protein